MAVPLLDIAKHNRPYLDAMKAALGQWLESGQYIGGPHVTGLEQELASYLGVSDCIAVSSGTDALLLALMALDLGPGDEVICPSFTFFATAGVVSRLGATPVFADLLPASFNIDPCDVAAKITDKTKAIIPVHLFGQMADLETLEKIASQRGIPIIEDCAQAIGASRHGRKAGTVGTFGSFSFYPTKNLSGFGDGGFLCTNDQALAQRSRILRIHGMDPVYYHSEVGGNFRFDPVQGALLRLKLPDLDSQNALRERNARHYHTRMLAHKDVSTSDAPHPEARVLLPSTSPGNNHTWHQFTLRVQGLGVRDALLEWLKTRKIGCGVYYPLGLHRQVCFQKVVPAGFTLPETERASSEVISLPIFPELTLDQLDEVCDALLSFLNH
jgi:dTDP-4-amino-4,6-dideoxygalactose transaminase